MPIVTRFVAPCSACDRTFTSKARRDLCDDCLDDQGRSDVYYGPNWDSVREDILKRDDYQCQNCGLSDEECRNRLETSGGLHVHHLVPAREFETYEAMNSCDNLLTLCPDCHRSLENETLDAAELLWIGRE